MKVLIAILVFTAIASFSYSQPVSFVKSKGYNVPIYDFKGLEPFLHTKSDTVYVVNFWATWCVPCVQELPGFLKLDSVYKNKKVKVLLVSLDMRSKLEQQLIPFMARKHIKAKVVVLSDNNQDSWIPKVDATWGGSIPCTLIFNKDKRKFYQAEFTYNELETELKNFNKN